MISQFHFKNFDADESLRLDANCALCRILDRKPADSTAVAVLEKQEAGFRCSLDIYSRLGPFSATSFRTTAAGAIQAVEEKLNHQIFFFQPYHREPTEQKKSRHQKGVRFGKNFLREAS
jgi:hypothetical protein